MVWNPGVWPKQGDQVFLGKPQSVGMTMSPVSPCTAYLSPLFLPQALHAQSSCSSFALLEPSSQAAA